MNPPLTPPFPLLTDLSQYVLRLKERLQLLLIWRTISPHKIPHIFGLKGAYCRDQNFLCAGTTPILEKTLRECRGKWKSSCGFPSIPRIAPGVAPRSLVFVLLKSWDAIPRMEFRILRAAPRIPRNSPIAPRMAFSLRERFS